MFRTYESARLFSNLSIQRHEGRGLGLFAQDEIQCSQTIIDEVGNMEYIYIQKIIEIT